MTSTLPLGKLFGTLLNTKQVKSIYCLQTNAVKNDQICEEFKSRGLGNSARNYP